MYCISCGSQKVEVRLGLNGSDYVGCEECETKGNWFEDDEEEE